MSPQRTQAFSTAPPVTDTFLLGLISPLLFPTTVTLPEGRVEKIYSHRSLATRTEMGAERDGAGM